MEFEWDEDKERENFERRGVDFAEATRIFADPGRLDWPDIRRDYGEMRRIAVGEIDGQDYLVVYTLRGETRRIITAWRLGRDGRARYQELYARTIAGNAPSRRN